MLKKLVISTALALAPFAASAATFDFSYTFDPNNTGDGNPLTVTGSLTGTLVGSFINNVANVQVAMNGTSFNGPLIAEAWNNTTQAWDNTLAPVVSTNAAANNFIFADTDVAVNPAPSNYLYFTGGQIAAINFNLTDVNGNAQSGFETANAQSWSLVAVPVPEPSSYALLLAGLGLVTLVARRRTRA
jgi:hypothetical protein